MKVSVIVPVYNVEKYLVKCLDSLVSQTLEDLEILVVNDGTPDNSQVIIDRYVEKYPGKVRGFIKENGGLASARNYALDHVKGEYIGFVDSDDWVDPEMYETMYNKAKETDADIVISNTVDHYPDHDVYHRQSDVSKFRRCGSVCNKLFRTKHFGDLRFPYGLWYEDLCLGMKLLMTTEKVSYCEEHFYHALAREGSIMLNDNSEKNLDIIKVMEELRRYAKKNGIYEKYKYEFEYMAIEHIMITTINRVAGHHNEQKKKVIKRLRHYVWKRYPNFLKSDAFREFPLNRRIVAVLNAYGFENVSQCLFKVKALIKRK